MKQPAGATSNGRSAARTSLRAALGFIGVVLLMAVVKLGFVVFDRFKRAGAPSTRSNIAMLESSGDNLRYLGFSGCPTVQQIMELTTPESARTDLLMDTNGIDPWGMPFQVECDPDKIHVFSMGPDKQAGTADDIRWKH